MSKPDFKPEDFTSTHLKKAAVSANGGVDPKSVAAYAKVFNDNGGNYDKIAAQLGVNWAPKAILPKTADDFAKSFFCKDV